jgi:hypothetical protein
MTDFSAPVLLQKILQSMENPRAPRRAALTYALMSLIVRLIASQAAVFNLWYGRRAYERSRGAMITMLYEKTLSRKVVSVSSRSREPEDESVPDVIVNGIDSNGTMKHTDRPLWKKAFDFLMRPLRARKGPSQYAEDLDKSKELATLGKIMNLMR